MKNFGRTIVVSNRLPISLDCEDGNITVRPSSGGLVAAMLPIVRGTDSLWIGWPGVPSLDPVIASALARSAGSMGIPEMAAVYLSEQEQRLFYRGCCNEMIWPLFHDLVCKCCFSPEAWEAYCEVNEKFADVVESHAARGDLVWVHDYHLMLLGESLRDRDLPVRTSYFHHIPFPSPDVLARLPWRIQLLRSLVQFQELGFQTARDRDNFAACVRRFLTGVGIFQSGVALVVSAEGNTTYARVGPISIDYERFASSANAPAIAASAGVLRERLGASIVLGVDRLDYTKGIVERLHAFEELLRTRPDMCGAVTLVQVVVPSREEVPGYRELKDTLEREVGRVNGKFGSATWTPVRYLHKNLSEPELVTLYRAADVMLVTPVKDGMNLVAKEFCAARVDERGVLVLSEFAGAAEELACGALLVNPYDRQQTSSAILRALNLSPAEQRSRMSRLREHLRMHNVFHWAHAMHALSSRRETVTLMPVPRFAEAERASVGSDAFGA